MNSIKVTLLNTLGFQGPANERMAVRQLLHVRTVCMLQLHQHLLYRKAFLSEINLGLKAAEILRIMISTKAVKGIPSIVFIRKHMCTELTSWLSFTVISACTILPKVMTDEPSRMVQMVMALHRFDPLSKRGYSVLHVQHEQQFSRPGILSYASQHDLLAALAHKNDKHQA